jgi:hypothetical protein
MKAYGHELDETTEELDFDKFPIRLREVSFRSSPDELRLIAKFIERCADQMEIPEEKWDHKHFQDTLPEWEEGDTDIIILG